MAGRKVNTFEDANALLAEWIQLEAEKHVPIEPHEITVNDYAIKTGVANDTARAKLDRWAKEDKWTRRRVNINGRWAWAYSPKVKPKRESK